MHSKRKKMKGRGNGKKQVAIVCRMLCRSSGMSAAYLPVVPGGTISLRCLTTSSLSESLASLARERIHLFVSRSGFCKEESSSFSLSRRWTTTLWASEQSCKIFPRMSLGRARDLSWWPWMINTALNKSWTAINVGLTNQSINHLSIHSFYYDSFDQSINQSLIYSYIDLI